MTFSSKCFYCSNSINVGQQPFVQAGITQYYKSGGRKEIVRNFHLSCFEEFCEFGRPYDPNAVYSVSWSVEMVGLEEVCLS